MRKKLAFIIGRMKAGRLQEMWRQTKWIYMYARQHWLAMIFYTLLGLSGTVISLIGSLVSKDMVDIITGHETGQVVQTFCIMIGMNLGSTFLTQISGYVSNKINLRVDADIKADIFSKILVTDWESLTNYHTGDLLTRWSSDASAISSGVLSYIPNLIIYIFRFASALVMMLYHDVSFAVIALCSMPVSLYLYSSTSKKMRKNNFRSAAMNAKMVGFNQESFSNIQTIKAFDMISLYIERLKQLQQEYIHMRLEFQRMYIGVSLLTTMIGMCVSYVSYGWGIYRVWSGAITYGTMTMFLSLSATLSSTLQNLISLVPTSIALTTSAGRLMDIVEMPREDYSQNDEVQRFWERHREEGIGLCVRDAKYAYNNGNLVFEHAFLEAHPHEVIGLVGPSGEGKTTMLRLILSLMAVQEGEALLCGGSAGLEDAGADMVPLTASTRKLFSYVPQGNTMFSGSIADNMRNVKPDASDEEIVESLKLACAWEFVEKLPDGINSVVKERGGGFSEGQAQRLSIARALLRRSPILLLDEATSALDVATERKVLKNIMQDAYPRTCIVTTHRPTVLNACNRVYAIREKACVVLTEEEIDELVRGF